MKSMHYILPGDPTPLARVRVNHATHKFYDGQSHIKLVTSITLQQQHAEQPKFTGPISLAVTFFMPIPTSASGVKKKSLMGKPHCSKSDLDNLIKYILDCGNKILYQDDAIVAIIEARKVYDANPRTEFTLTEIK